MTLSTAAQRNDYIGSGTTGPFPFTFKVFRVADLAVAKRSTSGIETILAYPTDFTVDASAINNPSGGAITLTAALAAGELLTIRRLVELIQEVDFRNQGAYFPEVQEDALDYGRMVDQQQQDEISRSLKFADTVNPASVSAILPAPEPSTALVWNQSATALTNRVLDASIDVALPGDTRTVSTLTDYLAHNAVFNVLDYAPPGTVWDGETDHSAYIEAAVAAACIGGGIVEFPATLGTDPVVYTVSRTITVASKYPVVLRSRMGLCVNPEGGFQSYIRPLAPIAGAMFEFATPTENRSDAGGGVIEGLVFFDPAIRSVAIGGALALTDFCRSTLRQCYFYGLKGAAFTTDYAVMSSARNVHVLYCGDTDVSAVTLGIVGADSHVTQSFTWVDGRLEVCYGAPYISMPAGTGPQTNNKLIGLGFEADPDVVESNQHYLDLAASLCQVQTCHCNRNTGLAMQITGSENVIDNVTFNAAGQKLAVSGDLNRFGNMYIRGDATNTGDDVAVSGTMNVFTGLTMRFAGRLNLSGSYNSVIGGIVMASSTANSYAVELGTGCSYTGLIRNSVTAGGARLTGTSPRLGAGTLVTGNAGIGVRNESSNAIVTGVHSYTNTTADFSANTAHAIVNNNYFLTGQAQEELRVGVLGKLLGANFNVTTDQVISIASASYLVTAVIVTNASIALTTAQGGLYTGTGKPATPVVASTQAYTDASSATAVQQCTLNAPTVRNTQGNLYLSLTTGQGAAATADVYIIGYKLD